MVGWHFARDQFLQREVDVHGGIDRIDAEGWHGAVGAFAGEGDLESINGCVRHIAVSNEADWRDRRNMRSDGSVHMRRFEHAVFDAGFCAVERFLAWLEEQLHGSTELSFVRLEKLCRAEQRGRVHIVATGMHAAVRRRKIDAGGFRNRQCVHVSTQKQARLPFAKLSNNAVAIHDRVKGHIHLGEARLHKGAGLWQIEAQLRHLMQGMAPGCELLLHGERFFENLLLIHDRSFLSYK